MATLARPRRSSRSHSREGTSGEEDNSTKTPYTPVFQPAGYPYKIALPHAPKPGETPFPAHLPSVIGSGRLRHRRDSSSHHKEKEKPTLLVADESYYAPKPKRTSVGSARSTASYSGSDTDNTHDKPAPPLVRALTFPSPGSSSLSAGSSSPPVSILMHPTPPTPPTAPKKSWFRRLRDRAASVTAHASSSSPPVTQLPQQRTRRVSFSLPLATPPHDNSVRGRPRAATLLSTPPPHSTAKTIINPLLARPPIHGSAPLLAYHLSRPPSSATLGSPSGPPLPAHRAHAEPYAHPPLPSAYLRLGNSAWFAEVRGSSVADLLRAAHDALAVPLAQHEWHALDPARQAAVGQAYHARVRRAPEQASRGAIRADALGGGAWFAGVEVVAPGVVVLHLA